MVVDVDVDDLRGSVERSRGRALRCDATDLIIYLYLFINFECMFCRCSFSLFMVKSVCNICMFFSF